MERGLDAKPAPPGFLAKLMPWQGFWGALLGFAGIWITLLGNGFLTRQLEADKVIAELVRENRARGMEASALRLALVMELQAMIVAGRQRGDGDLIVVHASPNDEVFRSSLSRMPILTIEEIISVHTAHSAQALLLTRVLRSTGLNAHLYADGRLATVRGAEEVSIVRAGLQTVETSAQFATNVIFEAMSRSTPGAAEVAALVSASIREMP